MTEEIVSRITNAMHTNDSGPDDVVFPLVADQRLAAILNGTLQSIPTEQNKIVFIS
jgi:hypothetical protein